MGDQKHVDAGHGDIADGDSIRCIAQRQVPVFPDDGIHAHAGAERYVAGPAAVDEGRALVGVELNLVRTGLATEST